MSNLYELIANRRCIANEFEGMRRMASDIAVGMTLFQFDSDAARMSIA